MTKGTINALVHGLKNQAMDLRKRVGGAVSNYTRYRRTYRELNALSIDGLLDLDLYRGDLKRIARQAVYAN